MLTNRISRCIVNSCSSNIKNGNSYLHKSFRGYCNDLLMSFSTSTSSTTSLVSDNIDTSNELDNNNNNNKNNNITLDNNNSNSSNNNHKNENNNNLQYFDTSRATIFKHHTSKKKAKPISGDDDSLILNTIILNYSNNKPAEARRLSYFRLDSKYTLFGDKDIELLFKLLYIGERREKSGESSQ
ncbi:hypothetical protein PPL_08662 [Heterostelium album PN500]|uniref:Uncharacterized protein n=1 Tax=Heterostelium pallidum (strain ATCC 26659 / Pp 5 / PN500) TaxID=670386 RepID=D3BJD7_HETP5|nr:hypothetical protein PPL_08662 [Heterostelium album PN500]EFA78017.1 hypothetical protein PPL_08662 [Heterostelium album PN500]|eukprot:XP_020430145.1 hypothetical protein PPL_08662 [Heterostelium album PN500]